MNKFEKSPAKQSANSEISAKDALVEYINELQNDYYKWYHKQMRSNGSRWRRYNYLILFSGIMAATLASLQSSKFDFIVANATYIQITLVILPLLSTIGSSILMQEKLFELYHLRESGRENIQFLISEGKRRLAISNTDAEFSEIHKFLIEEVRQVEISQAHGFFSVNSQRITAESFKVKSASSLQKDL